MAAVEPTTKMVKLPWSNADDFRICDKSGVMFIKSPLPLVWSLISSLRILIRSSFLLQKYLGDISVRMAYDFDLGAINILENFFVN